MSSNSVSARNAIVQCSICQEDGNQGAMARLDCNHLFDYACIDRWIREGSWRRNEAAARPTCPICYTQFEQLTINGENRPIAFSAEAVAAANEAMRVNRGREVMVAAQNNELEQVRAVFDRGDISEIDLSRAVVFATQNNNQVMVDFLLRQGNITIQLLCQAATIAARNGYLNFLRALVRHGDMSERDRGFSVRASLTPPLSGNVFEIVMVLIENGATLQRRDRGAAVILATESRRPDLVYALLANGEISDVDRNRASIIAEERGFHEIVRALDNKPQPMDIDQ